MSDSHLINSIKLLERAAEKQRWDIDPPSFNGEMAQYYAEQEWTRLLSVNIEDLTGDFYPVYELLVQESDRRDLQRSKQSKRKQSNEGKSNARTKNEKQ